ncbi:transposase [Methylocystis sp. JAN1]|uniref:transposase n=1 Tax=Methylocystis sp. JAN1 TaxID=3397211 RepID=UPI003FA25804
MTKDHKGWHSRGYLPHFDSPECAQHIVFRTFGSLPKSVLDALPDQPDLRRDEIDAVLDRCCYGPQPLGDPDAALIVQNALLYFDGVKYRLVAWCVMPNHVHIVAALFAGFPLGAVVKSWKAFTAAEINRRRGTCGAFWAPDYFDRYIRNERDLAATVEYVERNPVVAGLAVDPVDWPWSSAGFRRA